MRGLGERPSERKATRPTARRRSPTIGQGIWLLASLGLVGFAFYLSFGRAILWLFLGLHVAFMIAAAWRILLILASRTDDPPFVATSSPLPIYTILVPLHDEAEIVPELINRLRRIDYPADSLDGIILLEAHDHRTIQAVHDAPRPTWLNYAIVPPGVPTTKPRALNHGLTLARGCLLTVYDAEDEPHPFQLRQAAQKFSDDEEKRLACLQAPLRVRADPRSRSRFLDRQFAVEYASLFEVTLPGLTRFGLPLPLGGTSNHFRTDILREVQGWDAWNVTEDADLGFCLWCEGWRLDTLTLPTWETPPGGLADWLPQRARWLKGYMQTLGVHTRKPSELGWRGLVTLAMTIGMSLLSASIHAPALAWVLVAVTEAALTNMAPAIPMLAVLVLATGTLVACLNGYIGSRRAGVPYTFTDMIMSPIYWSLLTLAFSHAVWRLIREPFKWDKTRHRAPEPMPVMASDDTRPEAAGRQLA